MEIRYKIAFIFSLLVSGLFMAAGILMYQITRNERESRFTVRLKNRALTVANVYAGLEPQNFEVLKELDASRVASFYDRTVAILDSTNQIVYYHSDIKSDSAFQLKQVIKAFADNAESYRIHNGIHTYIKKENRAGKKFVVIVAQKTSVVCNFFNF